jgi:hypothetical protein
MGEKTYQYTRGIDTKINPVNAAGSSTKKRGIIIRTRPELEEITKLLSNPKVAQLAKNIDEVNPERSESGSKSSSDMFEIWTITM